jgi:hypothetical protein
MAHHSGLSPATNMNQLINPVGPEANNDRADDFEDQVVAFAAGLGWQSRYRNIDLYVREGGQSKGVDVLLACDDPQLGERHGFIGEAKIRHPLTGSVRTDVARLAAKVALLGGTIPQLSNANDLMTTRVGILVYDAKPFSASRLSEALAGLEPVGLTRAADPREVLVLAPDTLIGLSDAFGAGALPAEFYWPPYDDRPGAWGASAPAHQVAVGLLAWRGIDGTITLWLRDPPDHDDDFPEFASIAWEWRINVDRVVCSSLSRDRWRTVADRWRVSAKQSKDRDTGHLPDGVEARELSFDSMTTFVDRWGVAA